MSEHIFGREPVTVVEIDQDFCSRQYGVSPCVGGLEDSGLARKTYSMRFDAASEYIYNNASAGIVAGAVSVEAWAKFEAFDNWLNIFSKDWTARAGTFVVYVAADGYVVFGLYNGSAGVYATSNAALSLGRVYHIAATYDGTNMRVYVDGVAHGITGIAQAIDTTSGTIAIFQSGAAGIAEIEAVRVYPAALTAQQVADRYARKEISVAPCVDWQFDEGSGSTVTDHSGNGNHATIVSATYVDDIDEAYKIRLTAAASAVNDAYVPMVHRFRLSKETIAERMSAGYNGASKVLTLRKPWPVNRLQLPGVSGNYTSTPHDEAQWGLQNWCAYSEDLSSWPSISAALSLNYYPDPDLPGGMLPMYTLTDSDPADYALCGNSVVVPNDSATYRIAFLLRKDYTATHRVAVNTSIYGGGTPVYVNARFALDGTNLANCTFTDYSDDLWLVTITTTNNSTGNTTLGYTLYPASSTTKNGGDQVVAVGSAIFGRVRIQRDNGAGKLLPYLKTTGTVKKGEIDVRVKARLASWTSAVTVLAGKDNESTKRSWALYVTSSAFHFFFSENGSTGLVVTNVAIAYAANTIKHLRATVQADNGAGVYECKLYDSDDGENWNLLTTATGASFRGLHNGDIDLEVGSTGGSYVTDGDIYYCELRNAIDGEVVAKFDPLNDAKFGDTGFTAATGEQWTINTSGAKPARLRAFVNSLLTDRVSLPGVAGNYASTPDSAAVSITGDIDIRVKAALDDWSSGDYQTLLHKGSDYIFYVSPTGYPIFASSSLFATANADPAIADGAAKWVRVTRNATTGDIVFYTSDDGDTWTQLGSTISSTTGPLADSSSSVSIGERADVSAYPSAGHIYYAELRNGIDGTVVAKFDPLTDADLGDSSFYSSETGEKWTINTSGGSPAALAAADPNYSVIDRPNACFNTFATCQDTANYSKGVKTIRFVKPIQKIDPEWRAIPSVSSVSVTPARINAGGAAASSSSLGQRAACSVGFTDHPSSDLDLDPYVLQREYEPLDRGTFWTKWLARNKHFQNRPLRIRHGYTNQAGYLSLPGVAGNYASTPDSAAISITGDIDIRVKVALDDWTPAGASAMIGQWLSTGNQLAWFFRVGTTGALQFIFSPDGTSPSLVVITSTVAPSVSDGEAIWVRASFDADNGASGYDVTFYTSSDGVTWTQLGDVVTTATPTSIYNSNALLEIGTINGGSGTGSLAGSIYYAEVRNGINGTVVAQFDPARARVGDRAFKSRTGEQWTINTSGLVPAAIVGSPSIDQLPAQHFLMDRIDGPDSRDNVTIRGVDLLRLADDIRAQAPFLSKGVLTAALTAVATSFSVSGAVLADEYDSPSGTLRIGDEVMTYTGVSETSGIITFTGVTRGSDNTVADTHDEDDVVQRCLRFTSARPIDIISTLLTTYAGIAASYLDTTNWEVESDNWLVGLELTTLITEPTGVSTLIGEICEQVLLFLWWDERDQLIRLLPVRPPLEDPVTYTEEANIIMNSQSFKQDANQRISQLWVYYLPISPVAKLDDPKSYKRARYRIDASAESVNEYDEQRIKKIFSRWLVTDAQANDIGIRLLARYRDNPIVGTVVFDAKDSDVWTGDILKLRSRLFTDSFGAQLARQFQVISAEETIPREQIKLDVQNYEPLSDRRSRYTADTYPAYADADAAELALGAWYSGDDGLMPDGTEGWTYQ